eukprot:3259089-Alexandrium_andersonii.AAC.1
MAMVIFLELARMSAAYSSLWCSKSVRRRTQSVDWIPVSRSPSMSPPPSNNCWAVVSWRSRMYPYFLLISMEEGLALGIGTG